MIKKLLLTLFIALLFADHASAAISNSTVWEVRGTTGSDTNGGGFVAGASGTDYSQQASPQWSTTDLVTSGTTTVTSATASFTSAIVGNLCYIAGGSQSITAGWYQVTAYTNSTTITVDRSTGLTAGGTGATIHCGGALASLGQLATNMIAANKAFVKAEASYSITGTTTFSLGNNNPHTVVQGYTTTRTDGGRVTVLMASGSSYYGVTISGAGVLLENFLINANSLTGSGCMTVTGNNNYFVNYECENYASIGVNVTGSSNSFIAPEVTGGMSGATAGINNTNSNGFINPYVHDGNGPGIVNTSYASIIQPLVANQAGATADCVNSKNGVVWLPTVYGCGRQGVNMNGDGTWYAPVVMGAVAVNNGTYGIGGPSTNTPTEPFFDGNFYYNNASGTNTNINDTTTAKQNGVSPYTYLSQVTGTGSPFVNAAGANFGLNSTAGAGAAARAGSIPNAWGSSSTNGYRDMGAAQHQDPGVVTINPSFSY